jgi:pyridoxamine 5'-phosphate oxidase
MEISSIRKEYTLKSLDIKELNTNPIAQFQIWLKEAIASEVLEVNAMTLSTIGLDGSPNGRIVLLKEVDLGFVFFTNYQSEKGKELEASTKASLTFFWAELERQVRIKGMVTKIAEAESDEYFFSRPIGSQIGAWTSPQSQKIESREMLDQRQQNVEKRFQNEPMIRPAHWGGYRLIPNAVEFWQGRPSRLHDRASYELAPGGWEMSRLAP